MEIIVEPAKLPFRVRILGISNYHKKHAGCKICTNWVLLQLPLFNDCTNIMQGLPSDTKICYETGCSQTVFRLFLFFPFFSFFWEGGGFFSSFWYIHVAGENEMKGKWEHKRKSCAASTPCTVYNSALKQKNLCKILQLLRTLFFWMQMRKKEIRDGGTRKKNHKNCKPVKDWIRSSLTLGDPNSIMLLKLDSSILSLPASFGAWSLEVDMGETDKQTGFHNRHDTCENSSVDVPLQRRAVSSALVCATVVWLFVLGTEFNVNRIPIFFFLFYLWECFFFSRTVCGVSSSVFQICVLVWRVWLC